MTLPKKLLDKLVCPLSKHKLELDSEKNRLICAECKLAFRIENNIPVLLIDEAEKL